MEARQGRDAGTPAPRRAARQAGPAQRGDARAHTAIHVFSAQGSFRGGARFARHWHDVTRLDASGFADRELAQAATAHKSISFAELRPEGAPVDYSTAVAGALILAPSGDARQALAEDYRRMVDDGLLLGDAEPFDALLEDCQALALTANAAVQGAA